MHDYEYHLVESPRSISELGAEVESPWQDDWDGHRYRCHIRPDDLARARAQRG